MKNNWIVPVWCDQPSVGSRADGGALIPLSMHRGGHGYEALETSVS